MKIVHAVGWYFPESLGGSEVYVAGLCRHLRGAGEEVLIAAPDPAREDERTYEHEGVAVYRYPIPREPTRAEAQGAVLARGAERFHAWLARTRPDVVHFHTFVTGLGLSEIRAAKAAGARVIVTDHCGSLGWVCQRGTMMHWGERLCDGICQPAKCAACELQHRGLPKALARVIGAIPPTIGRVARSLRGRLGTALTMSDLITRNQAAQREMLETVDKFVLLTGWAVEAMVANGAPRDKLALNRLGLSDEGIIRKPGPHESPTRLPLQIGCLGRVDPVKGLDDLVHAVVALPTETPLRLELRGPVTDGAGRRLVRELQDLTRNDPRITLAPAVSPNDVPRILAGYDVLCCPSRILEGGPTVAIEAHAVGTPVIGTRIGGLAELVTDGVNGRLVVPGDRRALADVLREIVRDPAATIDRWRLALPAARTMGQVASDYRVLYST